MMRTWRNGRRSRLKICRPSGHAGSSPAVRTTGLMRRLAFLASCAILVGSCAGPDHQGADQERAERQGADRQGAGRTDEIIRLADADARGLDPQIVGEIVSVRIATDQFEGLTRFDAKGDAEAGLAHSWSISADGKVWTFYLRPNLKFSDLQPVTANVFEKALNRIREEKSGSPHASLFQIIDTVTATDPRTVIVRLKFPFPQLPSLLAHPAMAALPFHRIDAVGEKWTADRPLVTSGPYRLREWTLNQRLTLEANPEWHDGKPATAIISWQPMDNIQSGMRLMLANGADTSSDFPPSRLGWLKSFYPRLVRTADFLGTYYFAFNTRRPPFNDPRVRTALSMALDRDWIARELGGTGNLPAWGVLPPSLAGQSAYQPEWAAWTKAKRLREARRLLTVAGYGQVHPLRFEIRFNSSADHRRAAVAMATMWRELDVDARLLNSEASLHFDSLKRADFALARSGWIADLPAPENFLNVHRSDTGPQNYSGYAEQEFDAALDAALSQPDPAKRIALMRSAEARMMADSPILPLYFYVSRNLVQPRIGGWQDNIGNVHPSRTLFIRKP
jgi:oligopeptide transport system substrate-binding protein